MVVVSLSQIYSCVLCIPPLFRILYSVFMLVAAFKLLQRRCTFDCTLKPGLWENPQLRNSMIERRGRCRWRWGMILERRKEIRMSQWLVGWWEWYECLLRSILALCTPSVGPTIPSLGHHLSTGRHKNQTHVGLIFFAACKYFVFFWPLLCSFTLLLFDISADPASSFAADDVGCRVTSRPDWVSTRQAALLVRIHTQPVCL